MSRHIAFRRQPVDQQYAQALRATTLPAPTRGINQMENEAFMQPGSCVISDNWVPTLRGVKLRGGHIRWCDLHRLDVPGATNWAVNTAYAIGAKTYDAITGTFWNAAVAHTSAATGTFAADRAANPTFWTAVAITRLPVISAFEYASGDTAKMFAANATKLYDVTLNTPVLVKSGQASGNYVASQLAVASGNYLLALNDAGDYPLRYNGTSWVTLNASTFAAWANSIAYTVGVSVRDAADNSIWICTAPHTSAAAGTFAADRAGAAAGKWTQASATDGASWITGPTGRDVANGQNLTYVWKYRNRWFFIEHNSMTAWYLPLNAIGGVLQEIPLSGAATKGGKLLWGATWSIDAGDGIDDKNVFCTDQGELLIFTGSDPSNINSWRQEGRYQVSPPMGMNAHTLIGGDLIILTVDGMVPISLAIQKDAGQMELATLTRMIKPLWRENVETGTKRASPWTIKKWDESGAFFVAIPGGKPGQRYCLASNNTTGAWCRYMGWDATCFIRMRADMFFGTQDGIVMQADRTGMDDGHPYIATLVGGWEMFKAPSQQVTLHQMRAIFTSRSNEPFLPQLSATTDFQVVIPPPPLIGLDPGPLDLWDEGLWDTAIWDAAPAGRPPHRNTLWVSIGMTGFAHAPIVQVYVGQQSRPDVELVALGATYEIAGVNV